VRVASLCGESEAVFLFAAVLLLELVQKCPVGVVNRRATSFVSRLHHCLQARLLWLVRTSPESILRWSRWLPLLCIVRGGSEICAHHKTNLRSMYILRVVPEAIHIFADVRECH